MKEHLFLTRRDIPLPFWKEAFPALKMLGLDRIGKQLPLTAETMVWLHIDSHVKQPAALVEAIRKASPSCRVVVLSNIPNDEEGLAVLEAGASGYTGGLAVTDVLRQIKAVVENGGLWIGPALMKRMLVTLGRDGVRPQAIAKLDQLSPREREVALAVAAGATNKEVAQRLDISERTVKAHLSQVFATLHMRDRLQLAIFVNGLPKAGPPSLP
jgi:two-component system, NarL family, nitrate/nitrite response regulator NarL